MHFLNKLGIIVLGVSSVLATVGFILKNHGVLSTAVSLFFFSLGCSFSGYYVYPMYLKLKKWHLKRNQFVDSSSV